MKQPIISFQDFSFKYNSQKEPTLHDINLDIYEGEKVVIVGASGSGKSTLGHCINGLIPFSYQGDMDGKVIINGKSTKDSDIFNLSKSVGTVLQDPDGQFIGLTVGEDMAFALENDASPQHVMKKKVLDTSQLINMQEKLDSSVHALSGGQRQRVALGGVLIGDVNILLFDEPLANLDPKTGVHAIKLIDQLQQRLHTTVVMIEHRLEDVLDQHVDRIIVMENGRIISDAAPNELLASSVLEDAKIREPLYIRALKYANCTLVPDMKLDHINHIELASCKQSLQNWYKETEIRSTKKVADPVLEVEGLQFGYDQKNNTLHDISFQIQKGEMVSIVGKNGAGKSTLLRLICGFEKGHNGTIKFSGRDITKSSIKERAANIGMVMQNPNHMISKHMIFEEVALGLETRGVAEEEIMDRVEHALTICGLYPYRNWPISALSFGQRKRVTIASILVLNPEILILDEPTAGQDYYHYTQMMQFLEDLNRQGITILIVTHDMHLMLEYTDRSLVIADGKLHADASAVDILSDKDIVEEANLKQTSLFELAIQCGISCPTDFVNRFIAYDRGIRENGRNASIY